nr:ribonuclease H-like domain-containing protein [Tanacetum cinerariifolium]
MSDHEEETINEENEHPKVVHQITTVTNISTKFPYLKKGEYDIWAMKMQNFISSSDLLCWNIVLKGNSAKSMTTDKDGNMKIRPPITAEEYQQVQREEKARRILLSALLDEHMYFEEYDLNHQMAMLSIKVHIFEKKHGWKIKFNGIENARFDKKLVKCFNCKQMGHFSRECRAQGGQNSNNYRKYKSKEAGKDGSDSKAMVVVDDADLEGEVVSAVDDIPAGVLVPAGTVAAAVVCPQSETEFALMGLSTEVSIPVTCPLCCDSKYRLIEKDYQGQREQLNDCMVDLKAHKHVVKILEKQIKCHQTNQLAYEEKIRVLSYELEEKSNILEYRHKLIDQAKQEKLELMTKLDNELANQAKWNNSGEFGIDDYKFSIFHTNSDELEGQPIYNMFALVDHMKVVPPPLTGNYMPPSNIHDIDKSQMMYGKKATDSSKIKTTYDSITHTNDSVLFYFSYRSSEPSTNDLKICDSSVECSRPNHSDHDSTSSVSAPASESRDTIVIDCDKQEDFPSVYSIETDVKSSKPLRSYFLPTSTIPRRSRKQTTNVVEPAFRTIVEMADNRTMDQMLQAPIEGYEDAIVVPQINANNFELKQTLMNLVQSNQFTGRQDPHNHLRNKVTSTFRHPEDALDSAAGGNFMDKIPRECLSIIESKSKPSGNPTFSSHRELTSSKVKDDIFDPVGGNVLPKKLLDEHALDYSSPPIFDEYDDDFFEVESKTENVYDDPFDSRGEKIKEFKLLIDELDLPFDLLPSEYDSNLSNDFSKANALPSTNNEDKVFNPCILIQENPFEIITRVVQDKKLAISNASLMLEDFDPPLYELNFFKEVPRSNMLLPFSSKNEKKVFKPGIHTFEKVHSSLITELSHQGYNVFKINQIFKSPMKIFLFFSRKDTHILVVPYLHFYPLDRFKYGGIGSC